MASVIVEEVVEEIVEEVVEQAVEEAVEEAVENAVEDAVEDAVEESVEESVEEAVENAVEEAVDEAVEEDVEADVENAVGSTIKRKIIIFIVGLIVSVVVIGPIIDLIKADAGVGKKKCDIDEDTKKKMNRSEGVLGVLGDLLKAWTGQLKQYKSKDSLGKVTYRHSSTDAGGVVWSLFNDMKNKLQKAQRITDECKDNCRWKANIDVFELDVLQAAYNVNAIFLAKDHAPVMKQKNFPPEADRNKMTEAFNKFYNKDWRMIIKMNAKKNLTKAIKQGAAKASEAAVKKLITKPLSTGIKAGIEKDVVPDVKKEAKSAAKAETTIVFNDWNSRINKHAAIPVYGISTLKSWMMDNVKPDAVKNASAKARAAADAVMELPDAQIKIMNISSDQKDKVLKEYRSEIRQCANQAADDYIQKALAEHKSKNK